MDTIPALGASSPVQAPSREMTDLPLFASLNEVSRRRLLDAARIERVPANQTLFEAGEQAGDIHVLLRGMIDIACKYRSKHCTAMLMTSGDVLMLGSPLYNEPYLVAAETLTQCRIMKLD